MKSMTVLPTVVTNWVNPDTVSVTREALVVGLGSTDSWNITGQLSYCFVRDRGLGCQDQRN